MRDNMSASDFEAKIEWEGGAYDAWEYGLKASDLAPSLVELRKAWEAFDAAMQEASGALMEFNEALERALRAEEELD